jgi:ubiquitin thioesterase OTU1
MKTTESSTTNKNLSEIGQLIRYSVPADNSCLFSSIHFVLHSGKLDLSLNKYLRNLVATKIESDQITYSEAILGRTNSDYCKWIRRGKPKTHLLF